MNPPNDQNTANVPNGAPDANRLTEQVDQQALEAAKNIVAPIVPTVVEPLRPFPSSLNEPQQPKPQQPSQVVVSIMPSLGDAAAAPSVVVTQSTNGLATNTVPPQPTIVPAQPISSSNLSNTTPPQQPMPSAVNTQPLSQPLNSQYPQPHNFAQPNQFNQNVTNQFTQSSQPQQQHPVFAAPTMPTQYIQQSTILTGSVDEPTTVNKFTPNFNPPKPPSKKKYIIGGLVCLLVVVAGLSAFMFLIYLPNLPQNVWKTGISRTNRQVDAIISKINDPASRAAAQKNKLTIKGKLELSDNSYAVDIGTKIDKTNSNSTLAVKAESKDVKNSFNINAELNTKAVENARYPNIYFKLSGFSGLGLDGLMPSINNYDGKWISVEQDYLKRFESTNKSPTDTNQNNITSDDIFSIIKDANSVTKEYLLTNDQAKSVIIMMGFKATEKSEGITANHYTAKLNHDNVKAYCTALAEKMSSNSAAKKISAKSDEDFAKYIQELKDDCSKVKSYDKEFDIWVDKKYKLFHKVRIYEDINATNDKIKADKAQCMKDLKSSGQALCADYDRRLETGQRYQEIGQVYKGGDQFVMFVNGNSDTDKDKSKARAELSINAKTLAVSGTTKVSVDGPNSKYKLDLAVATEPYSGAIDTEKPAGAIPIQQLLDALKFSPL